MLHWDRQRWRNLVNYSPNGWTNREATCALYYTWNCYFTLTASIIPPMHLRNITRISRSWSMNSFQIAGQVKLEYCMHLQRKWSGGWSWGCDKSNSFENNLDEESSDEVQKWEGERKTDCMVSGKRWETVDHTWLEVKLVYRPKVWFDRRTSRRSGRTERADHLYYFQTDRIHFYDVVDRMLVEMFHDDSGNRYCGTITSTAGSVADNQSWKRGND